MNSFLTREALVASYWRKLARSIEKPPRSINAAPAKLRKNTASNS